MKRKLESIAQQLSENDIREIIRLKKMGDKKTVALRKKRDKMAAALAKLDAQLEKIAGEAPAEAKAAPRTRRAKGAAGPKAGAKKQVRAKKTANAAPARAEKKTARGGKKTSARRNVSAAVREVFRRADKPLKASEVVDGLPMAGIPVADVADMRKRISVVLASQKNHFEQVERGVYRLKE